MSIDAPEMNVAPATTTAAATVAASEERPITIISHSTILYWWPVWAVCLVMAAWTYFDGYVVAFVPHDSAVEGNVLTAPPGTELSSPILRVARSRWPGLILLMALLLSVHLSCASLRGPWGLFGLAIVAVLVLLFNWLHWWDPVLSWFGLLRIHLNMGAYLTLGLPLLVMWAFAFFAFDRRTYAIVTTGQVRVCDELGAAEKVHDVGTVSFEKEPYDWLRWFFGFCAGDVLVRVGGPQTTFYSLINVCCVGSSMKKIERRLRTRDVIERPPMRGYDSTAVSGGGPIAAP
jgi:hypothetical protein